MTETTTPTGQHIDNWLNEKLTGKGVTRRDFLKGTGVLIVSCSVAGVVQMVNPQVAAADFSALVDPSKIASWLAIGKDGGVTVYHGKVDNGQGVATAFRQVVAEELDISIDRVKSVVGDTALTVDQVGASGSTGLKRGSPPVRAACAEARMVLLAMASQHLRVPAGELTVRDGVVSARGDASKSVSYGDLVGSQTLNATLEWNKQVGGSLAVKGRAKLKSPDKFTVVGQPVPREDIPPIVFGKEHHIADLRLPGMVHARSIKPPVAGARLVKVDESSLGKVPGVVKVVTKGDYVGVVCEREEQAVKAARLLKVEWSDPSGPSFPTDAEGLYDYLRHAPSRLNRTAKNVGNVDEALGRAARIVEATYETPFQSHASFAPGCAVANWQNGEMTVWTGTQKPYRQREGLAHFLGLPREKVRVIWKPGPGSYGRNDAGDVAFEAAFLPREVGRPVRLHWMRNDGIAWDPKAPASVIRLRGGFDAEGNMIAYDWDNRSLDHQDVASGEEAPGETLIGQFLGFKNVTTRNRIGTPDESYSFPNKRWNLHIALRGDAATIAEVEVNLETGRVRVTRFVCSHACGVIVNPDGLKNVIEGNLLHSMSRTLYEEVKFNRSKVTSVDWRTYPIATIMDVPDRIDKVLINEPHLPPDGAGEETSAQTQPAIANAIFDATGVRIRRLPFTADRVMAALKAS